MLLSLDDRIFGLDAQLIFQLIFTGIAIFLLFMAASYLLLDPVRKKLNDRKEKVMREQREALENREAALRMREEYDGKLREINKTAEQILSDSRKKAMQRENEIILNAREEAGRIIAGAKEEAALEQKRVNDEVKQEIISVASLLSEKLVAASLDEEKQNALIEQTLREIGDDTWQSRYAAYTATRFFRWRWRRTLWTDWRKRSPCPGRCSWRTRI